MYFERVENILKNFPIEYQKNYFINKDAVTIDFKEKNTKIIDSSYDNNTNTITIYNESSLPRGLFHMAFRDPNKVGIKIYEDKDINIYYSNGIALECHKNNEKVLYHKGMLEGFVEYLNRKVCDDKGQHYNFFFVDLLISIHGEDILKYPFQNDSSGLLEDERFYDILELSHELDTLNYCKENIIVILKLSDLIEKSIYEKNKVAIDHISKIREQHMSSVIGLFENIINEYNNCANPNIDKENFIKKLECFLYDPDYSLAFCFDNNKYSLREKIINIINSIKKDDLILKKTK